MLKKNIYNDLPNEKNEEIFENLLIQKNVKIERIISFGQNTPENEWYDQTQDEWVILLSGQAKLKFENEAQIMDLFPGDYILIPSGVRHRVEWTLPNKNTIWLAIHIEKV